MMQFKRVLLVSLTLAVLAFGSYGLNSWVNSKLPAAQADAPTAEPPAKLTVVNTAGGPGGQVISAIEIKPAPELPARAPDAGGAFGSRDGQTLTLQSFRFSTAGGEGATFSMAEPAGAASGTVTMLNPGDAPQGGVMVFSQSALPAEAGALAPAGQAPMIIQGFTVTGQAGELPAAGATLVGPGEPGMSIAIGSGQPGEKVEQKVVVTDATKIYRDATPMVTLPNGGSQTIQQVLAPATLDELNAYSMVTVWGHTSGEQLIADVILVQNPPTLPQK